MPEAVTTIAESTAAMPHQVVQLPPHTGAHALPSGYDGAAFAKSMQTKSYAVVPLPPTTAASLSALLETDAPGFFSRSSGEKASFAQPALDAHGCPAYRGYVSTAAREVTARLARPAA